MRLWSIALGFAILCPAVAEAVGFEQATIPTSPPIEIGIWYPSSSSRVAAVNVPFGQALAVDGEIEGEELPLVLLSHGHDSNMHAHVHTALALAEAGYVAVALTHPGDNAQNQLTVASDWLVSRPADISRTLDYMVSDWIHADVIDADRIGVFGFSMGGYTALAAAGALIDIDQAARHCAETPEDLTCDPSALDNVDPTEFDPRLRDVAGDPRVAAIVVVAPGYGYAFDREALENVTVPVQIWSGSIDELTPHIWNGAVLAANLPDSPEVHVVENAGHLAFAAPCPESIRHYDRYTWDTYCRDAEGFDRAAFHAVFHQRIVDFLDSVISP
ncbi:alpha/beta fold hydrolase [Gymnodinialimonas sp. 2305UL16-5]|uniref:alpha/beta hydrolase family protein n=1 Tax=Gymnodinialimonas mytili TaxID=3126503 RepID=UPI0030A8F2C6